MFQALSQGAVVSIFYRNEPRVVDGRVVSVNTHMPIYNPNQPMAMFNGPVTDITVQVGNDTVPFAGLPANGVVANFPDKGMYLSTDRTLINREIESMASALEQDLSQTSSKEAMLESLKKLLVESNVDRKFQEQQSKEIETLKTQLAEVSGKFDKVVEMLSEKLGS